MHRIERWGIAHFFEEVVSFFGRYLLANQSQPPGDAVDVGIYREGRTAE
jgi:hypothetical protein